VAVFRLIEILHQMLDDTEDVAPSRCSTFLHYSWKVCSCVFSHVILVSLVVSYCIMGAFTFQNLEKNNEIKVQFFFELDVSVTVHHIYK